MIVLASASPRRREILERYTDNFKVAVPKIEEDHSYINPVQLVCALAFEKAYSLWKTYPEDIVIGSDTVVALGEKVMGKPDSRSHAREMLRLLSGKTHQVYTGYSLLRYSDRQKVVNYSRCDVSFRTLDDDLIERYLDRGEYIDKAGGYGIQGLAGIFVKEIRGDYDTVVGFPIGDIGEDLRKYFHIELL